MAEGVLVVVRVVAQEKDRPRTQDVAEEDAAEDLLVKTDPKFESH
jgi:hypothetical protein